MHHWCMLFLDNKMIKKIGFLLISTLVLNGCAEHSEVNDVPVKQQHIDVAESKVRGVDYSGFYQLQLSGYSKFTTVAPSITLRRSEGGYKLYGDLGCNSVNATVNISDRRFEPIKEIKSSKIVCGSEEMRRERSIILELYAGSGEINKRGLLISNLILTKLI